MGRIVPPLTAEESAELIEACRSLMGVKFRHQGINPKIGVDCRGMIIAGLIRIGRTVFKDVRGYGRDPHKDGLRQALVENFGSPLPISERRPGDIPLMRLGGEPRHVGIFTRLPDGRMGLLHTHAEMKYVAEHGADGYHADFVEVYRP